MSDKKSESKLSSVLKFLWNKDTKEVLGRTGTSWFKIFVFYVIFYACLTAFFGLMLYIFYLTLDIHQPKYLGSSTLIGTNPGVGFRPQPDEETNVDSTLIWYKKSDHHEYSFWSSKLKKHIEDVEKVASNAIDCKEGTDLGNNDNKGHSCKIKTDKAALGPCTTADDFGYKYGAPCILIKLNRIYGWKPEAYGSKKEDYMKVGPKSVLEDLPLKLAKVISAKMENATVEQQKDIMGSVWIHCEGENPADRENIGHLEYYPSRAINSYYFPFTNQEYYRSPFVMVHFQSVTPGVLINVECKAYAKNIKPDRSAGTGSVHFELLID